MEITKERLEKSILKKIGDFRIFQDILLGKGSFGEVYLSAKYNSNKTISLSDQLYAAKAINKKAIDPKKLAKFEESVFKEIFILKNLHHPNIVTLIDVRSTENRFYLIFEYCSGGTLETYRKSKGVNAVLLEAEALEITKQIAEAMQFCVTNNPPIIHRDLKPANVLLEGGKVKISDFGFARLVENTSDKLKLTTNIGSPLYMAPEIYKGEPYNTKCDVWSLGIILFELLFGRTPWNSKLQTEDDLFKKNILKKPLIFPDDPKIKEATKQLIMGMLQLEQDERMTFEQVLDHAALKPKKHKIKNEEDSQLKNLNKSVSKNLELINKYPLVENCYVNKAKSKTFEEEEKKNNENNDSEKKMDDLANVFEVTNLISKEEIEKNNIIVKQAEDFVGFYLNIVRFLRKVFHHIKAYEKKLRELEVSKQNLMKYMLFLKKMELIVLFKIKKILENGKVNDSLVQEFYATSSKIELLNVLKETFEESMSVFNEILEESMDFEEKTVYFKPEFDYNAAFNKGYRRQFEEFWNLLKVKLEKMDGRMLKLTMEVGISRDLFEFFRFVKGENNTDQFYQLYQDLKNPEKVTIFLEKKVKKEINK